MRDWHLLSKYIAMGYSPLSFWKWTMALFMAGVQYILPSETLREMAVAAFVFVIMDTISGVVAAGVTREPITSSKLGRFFIKVLGYSLVIATCSITARMVLPGEPTLKAWLLNAILWVILLTEAVSILENCQRMGIKLPKWIVRLLKGQLARIEGEAKDQDPTLPKGE